MNGIWTLKPYFFGSLDPWVGCLQLEASTLPGSFLQAGFGAWQMGLAGKQGSC